MVTFSQDFVERDALFPINNEIAIEDSILINPPHLNTGLCK